MSDTSTMTRAERLRDLAQQSSEAPRIPRPYHRAAERRRVRREVAQHV